LYRTIDASFWTDPKVAKLGTASRLALIYLITNPHSHVGGIYHLRLSYMIADLGISAKMTDAVIRSLSDSGFIRFDSARSVFWVVNMFKYQGRGEKNERAVANHLGTLHGTPLVSEFLTKYPSVGRFVRPENRVSEPVDPTPDTLSDFGTQIRSGTDQDKEQDQEQIPRRRGIKTPPPDSLVISPELKAFAIGLGVFDIEEQTEAMLDHFRAKGESRADWVATWRTWIRNSKKFNRREGYASAKSKTDINRENAERLRAKLDSQDSGSEFGSAF
jgi:hypothetical protein